MQYRENKLETYSVVVTCLDGVTSIRPVMLKRKTNQPLYIQYKHY